MAVINSFPGYEYVDGKNLYRGTDVGRGGYIISHPGIYTDVVLLDIASLHPNSIRAMNCFGEYTKNFTDILDARIAIKHGDYESARQMLDGRLAPYLDDESTAKDLAQALKIAVNSVYGLTAANFDNPFRDIRNKNNIVALRGALFMRTLQDEVENRGFQIVAIKTDSIKIANATKEIVDFCFDFASQYGYTFEHEATYDRMCQINDADYIAKYASIDRCIELHGVVPGDNNKKAGKWTATGAQFQVPYVFKKLFSHEPIGFEDMCETKSVTSALYLRNNDPDTEEIIIDPNTGKESTMKVGDKPEFIGKVGCFCPIKPGRGGKELLRESKDAEGNIKYASATGAKGYFWLEAEAVQALGKEDDIDRSYYDNLVDNAVEAISKYGDFEWFVSDDPYPTTNSNIPPWDAPDEPWYDSTPFDVR